MKVPENLKPGQLVVMGSLEDISKRRRHKLGRIEEVIPQIRNGKPTVRRAKMAVIKLEKTTGEVKIKYVLQDVSCLASVKNAQLVAHLRRAQTTAVACFPVKIEMCNVLSRLQLSAVLV